MSRYNKSDVADRRYININQFDRISWRSFSSTDTSWRKETRLTSLNTGFNSDFKDDFDKSITSISTYQHLE